ncbi:hypothetical protein [Bacillus subtilis]|uniref:hypothetical protein n=1 Tax=Bacillus subtilis TaxID=1423 RepID=UPI002DB5E893|nr:hypothetical protein [Bacillus subtilis]MEC2335180.1 hypothetical protein [Bacillus subtilis]
MSEAIYTNIEAELKELQDKFNGIDDLDNQEEKYERAKTITTASSYFQRILFGLEDNDAKRLNKIAQDLYDKGYIVMMKNLN